MNPIAIISMGAILPESESVHGFWKVLESGESVFSEVPQSRFLNLPTLNRKAGVVSDEILTKACLKRSIERSRYTRTQLFGILALSECLEKLSIQEDVFLSLGCMDQDEEAAHHLLKDEGVGAHLSMPSLVNTLIEHAKIKGEGLVVDAACASSLAALDVAIDALNTHRCSLAISGGIEANLSAESFAPFEKLGVLSKGQSIPFDIRTDGLMQGEGAVLFALRRLEDALEKKDPILGILTGCESLSNGSTAGVFAPSKQMQKEVFSRLSKEPIHYIEAHGTGTQTGDQTELEALEESFCEQQKPVALGATKTQFGHTKGAAGAVGILKALYVIQRKKIPGSPLCKTPREGFKKMFVPSASIDLGDEPIIRCRVNGTGFGGANYQIAIQSLGLLESQSPLPTRRELKEIGYCTVSLDTEDWRVDYYDLKLPPVVRSKVDRVQIAALLSVAEALERSFIPIALYDSRDVSILSIGAIGLPSMRELCKQVHLRPEEPLNEQCAGALNSLVPGRVSNLFDFRGKNFHIDAGEKSTAFARDFLSSGRQKLGILLEIEECSVTCRLFQ